MYEDERTSAVTCLIIQSDLRLQVLGNQFDNNSLTIEDLPELKIRGYFMEFTRIPAIVIVRSSLSKYSEKMF